MARNSKPQLVTTEIQDIHVRRNFEALKAYFEEQNQLLDFKFVEMNFTTDVSLVKIRHGLKIAPRDLIRMEVTGPGTITFHRGLFTEEFIIVSSTAAVHVRLLAGLHRGSGATVLAEDATEQWKATV